MPAASALATWLDVSLRPSGQQPGKAVAATSAMEATRFGDKVAVAHAVESPGFLVPEAGTRAAATSRRIAASTFLEAPARSAKDSHTSFLQSKPSKAKGQAPPAAEEDDDDDLDEREATIKVAKDGSGVPRYENMPVCCNGEGAESNGQVCEKTCVRDPRYSKWVDGVQPMLERPTGGMPPPRERFSLKALKPVKVPKNAPWKTYWNVREPISGSYDGWAAEIIPPLGTVEKPRPTIKTRSRRDLEADSA